VQAVGIGVPGTPDLERGLVLILPNLPGQWRNVPLQAEIEQHLGLPARLINDVRAITLGEWAFGAGRGVQTVACYAIGTGIGGGLIAGRLYLGMDGTAEFGYMVVEPFGLPCSTAGVASSCISGPAIAMGAKAVMTGIQP
jgi:glucokinase